MKRPDDRLESDGPSALFWLLSVLRAICPHSSAVHQAEFGETWLSTFW